MSHHYSGPNWGFPRGDARLDLTDLYAFPKPGDGGKSSLGINVDPAVRDYVDGAYPPELTPAQPLTTEPRYEHKEVGLRHRTLISSGRPGGSWIQAERGALPLQLFLVLGLTGEERDAYLTGQPAEDVRFVAAFAHALEHTGGYTAEEASRVAGTLLPEILSYDPTRPASFPDNGRALTDDAVDAFLAILPNGKVMGDKVGPHGDMITEFPYLGPPRNA